MAIGTRLASASRIVRGPKREAISRSYNLLLRATLHNGFSDAQCGFKAVRRDVARALLPLVEDQGWFFDTELLVLAEANGLRIHEVPVDWVDDPDSRVDVVSTARDDLLGIWRMLKRMTRGEVTATAGLPAPMPSGLDAARPTLAAQSVRFASIGLVSTVVFAVLYALLFGVLGAVAALVVAFGLCSVVNTAANRRLTFALRGRSERSRHVLAGAAVAGFPLVLDLAALGLLAAAGVTALGPQLVVLTLVNGVAAVARFLLLRRWVFRPAAPSSQAGVRRCRRPPRVEARGSGIRTRSPPPLWWPCGAVSRTCSIGSGSATSPTGCGSSSATAPCPSSPRSRA